MIVDDGILAPVLHILRTEEGALSRGSLEQKVLECFVVAIDEVHCTAWWSSLHLSWFVCVLGWKIIRWQNEGEILETDKQQHPCPTGTGRGDSDYTVCSTQVGLL